MPRIAAERLLGQEIGPSYFGANILATRDRLGPDGTYDDMADQLGINAVRYPGGSLTERYFDITNPDQTSTLHYITGQPQPLLPFSEFMQFAADTGRPALIVLPTRTALGPETDALGHRYPAIDEAALRGFVRDTLDGAYGPAQIAGFELGNEYWGAAEMSAVEYGRVASEMALIVKDELVQHPDYEIRFQDTEIYVQMGMNFGHSRLSADYDSTDPAQALADFARDYGLDLGAPYLYGNGNIAWPQLNNLLILREFDTPAEMGSIDGVVAHIYAKGLDNPESQHFALRTIEATWPLQEEGLKTVVTEWNIRNHGRDSDTDYGLIQAHEMLDTLAAMATHGVDQAYVWPMQQGARSSLAGNEGDAAQKVAGTFFKMMGAALPGTHPVVLEGAEIGQTELAMPATTLHAFAGHDHAVFYALSTDDTQQISESFDLSGLVQGWASAEITRLGVAPGDLPGAAQATPVLTALPADEVLQDGVLGVDLAPREIMQVVLRGVSYTPDTQDALDQLDLPYFAPASFDAILGLDSASDIGAADITDLAGLGTSKLQDTGGGLLPLPLLGPETLPPDAPAETDPPPPDDTEPASTGADFGLLLLLPMLLMAMAF